jgi:hypothetical protein
MIALYHFTKIQNVPSIMREGLRLRYGHQIVGGMPVVWLTEQRTRRDFLPGWSRDCRKRGWRGSATWLDGQSVRLTISKPNVLVVPWLEWVSRQPFYEIINARFAHHYMSKWWIAFAPISPDCISVGSA